MKPNEKSPELETEIELPAPATNIVQFVEPLGFLQLQAEKLGHPRLCAALQDCVDIIYEDLHAHCLAPSLHS